jgi:hypothetical protein
MVPRAVASIVSYEAERRMMRSPHPRARLTQDDWKKQRGLLRFGTSAERLTGLPLMLLVYPCLTFARDFDPRELARGARLTAVDVRGHFAARIRSAVERLGIVQAESGAAYDRWYWLAPMLLDFAEFPAASRVWWGWTDLAQAWIGAATGDEDAGWSSHLEKAKETLENIRHRRDSLGIAPDDLFDLLALATSAASANVALRAYARASRSDPAVLGAIREAAGRTGRAFLTLFNHAEVIEVVRSEFRGEPYWQRVLEYAHYGGLQAVPDEYVHLLLVRDPAQR